MAPAAENALIVQSDSSVLLEVHAPRADEARAALAPFAELVKSPEHVHTYRLTPLSIWNARAAGVSAEQMVEALREHARYAVPPSVEQEIIELAARYGRVVIARDGEGLRCSCHDQATAERLARDQEAGQYLVGRIDATSFRVDSAARGVLKQALVGAGYPAEDLAGYVAGEPFDVELRDQTVSGMPFRVREYQRQAAQSFYLAGSTRGGSGVIVLPCGAGKTIVGLAAMELVEARRPSWSPPLDLRQAVAARAAREDHARAGGHRRVHRRAEEHRPGDAHHLPDPHLASRPRQRVPAPRALRARSWGLIIYDEVHLLPAPVFRITAELQARQAAGAHRDARARGRSRG